MGKPHRYSAVFSAAYFIYYCGYCIFSSFIVLYLTELGYSATFCGTVTAFTVLANLIMEPIGGYITDTFLTTKKYLALSVAFIVTLNAICVAFKAVPYIFIPALILTAGFAYPFSQLMDAWVNCSRPLDDRIIYSRIRAGGSIGFAIMSVAAGYYFERFGWCGYFPVQSAMFILLLPLLAQLPDISLENSRQNSGEENLSFTEAFGVVLKDPQYMAVLLICTMYWFSHRPVGSFLSLIARDRAGGTSTFGNVSGVGAAVEFLVLLAIAAIQKRGRLPLKRCMLLALLTDLMRPLLLCLFPGVWPLYLGQILQSFSFAYFMTASVACFTQAADPRIRSFCISMGLTVSSVVGMLAANLLGGMLCDRFGTASLSLFSLSVAALNTVFFILLHRVMFSSRRLNTTANDPLS